MYTVKNIQSVTKPECDFLTTQTQGNDGYMSMYLNLCRDAFAVYGKTDFFCDVIIDYNSLGAINAWCILQNLLYRHDDYIDLSIWVPKSKRLNGHGTRLMNFIEEKYKDKKISVWASRSNHSFHMFSKFSTSPFHIFDVDVYHTYKEYKMFDFS